MPKPMESAGDSAPPEAEDQTIRHQVKGLTSQVLQQGRIDPEVVRDVVRAVIGGPPREAVNSSVKSRESFANAVRELDEALVKSANAAHGTLQQIAARGKDFTDNDLKDALATLRKLEEDYIAAANHIALAMNGDLRREMRQLAVHAQNVGVEASARLATGIGNFANGISVPPGLATIRGASARMAFLASGVLAGVADALRDQKGENKDK